MVALTPKNRANTIRLLRNEFSNTELRDVANSFGAAVGMQTPLYDQLEGDSHDEHALSIVNEALRRTKIDLLYDAIVDVRPDLATELPSLITETPTPNPPVPLAAFMENDDTGPAIPAKVKDYHARAQTAATESDYDLAITLYSLAISLDLNDALAYLNRGINYSYKREYDKALADLTKAVALDPHSAIAYYNRGKSYHFKDQYDLAILNYTKALDLDPLLAAAYYNRGAAYQATGDPDAARADFRRAADLGLKDAQNELARLK